MQKFSDLFESKTGPWPAIRSSMLLVEKIARFLQQLSHFTGLNCSGRVVISSECRWAGWLSKKPNLNIFRFLEGPSAHHKSCRAMHERCSWQIVCPPAHYSRPFKVVQDARLACGDNHAQFYKIVVVQLFENKLNFTFLSKS